MGPAVHGIMVDVARGRVPTIRTLAALVERLAPLGLDHLELYMEAAFAYRAHEVVWAGADPYTIEDIRRLDAVCAQNRVALVPNQNTLGHLERWLRHEPYRALAATPDGWRDDRGNHELATTLDPGNPDAFALIASLLAELRPAFTAEMTHVGLDEPLDLNPEVWALIYDHEDADVPRNDGGFMVPLPAERLAQYLAWVRDLRGLEALGTGPIVMWGDVLAAHPEALSSIPGGVIVAEWGYEADHPFAARSARLAEAALPFWVAPGTAAWSGILGRPAAMCANVLNAVAARDAFNGAGLLMTDWGNRGAYPVTEAGYAFALLAAHDRERAARVDLGTWLDAELFRDPTGTFGRTLVALGELDATIPARAPEIATLSVPVLEPDLLPQLVADGMTLAHLEDAQSRLEALAQGLADARPEREDADLLLDEVRTAAALQRHVIRVAQVRLDAPEHDLLRASPDARGRLAEELAPLLPDLRRVWLGRNRPSGLDEAMRAFEHQLAAYDAS